MLKEGMRRGELKKHKQDEETGHSLVHVRGESERKEGTPRLFFTAKFDLQRSNRFQTACARSVVA